MLIFYSVIDCEALILRSDTHLEGAGIVPHDTRMFHNLRCTDCLWIIPGTITE